MNCYVNVTGKHLAQLSMTLCLVVGLESHLAKLPLGI